MNRKAWILIVVLSILLVACGGTDESSNTTDEANSGSEIAAERIEPTVAEGQVKIGAPAPHFRLQATDGRVVDLSELKGQAVVLNFWATWCGPCRAEMPELEAAYQENRDNGLQLIGIEISKSGNADQSAIFLKQAGATFPNVRDQDSLMEQRYIKRPAYPTTIFIDREGVISYVQLGPMNKEFIKERLNDLGF